MNVSPAPPTSPPDAPHPAAMLAELLDTIFASIWNLLGRSVPFLTRFTPILQNRFNRARVRVIAILTRLVAGTWRPSRKRNPRPDHQGGTRLPYSPQGNLWLVRKLGYHAAGFAAQLTHALNRPETLALLATMPPEARAAIGRTLRPLARLLGTDLPPDLRPTPAPALAPCARPEPARPARTPKPAPEPHRHPIYPQRKPRFTLYPDPPRRTRPA